MPEHSFVRNVASGAALQAEKTHTDSPYLVSTDDLTEAVCCVAEWPHLAPVVCCVGEVLPLRASPVMKRGVWRTPN